MQLLHLHRETPRAQAAAGNGTVSQAMPAPAPTSAGIAAPGMAAQLCVMASLLAGLWAAISPWFLTMQAGGDNASVNNLIVGLVVVALAMAVLTERGRLSLQAASGLAGVWLIISPFILDAKFQITPSMYWSNPWTGGVIVVLALAALALGRPATRH